MMDDNFSSRVKDVISYSKEEALRLGHKQIGTEHLLLGMLRDCLLYTSDAADDA